MSRCAYLTPHCCLRFTLSRTPQLRDIGDVGQDLTTSLFKTLLGLLLTPGRGLLAGDGNSCFEIFFWHIPLSEIKGTDICASQTLLCPSPTALTFGTQHNSDPYSHENSALEGDQWKFPRLHFSLLLGQKPESTPNMNWEAKSKAR